MSKQAGRMSQSANDFLQPSAVTSLSATDVGTGRAFNNGAASLTWTLPADSPAATSYDVTTTPATNTTNVTVTSATITGLASDTAYTFTVVAKNAAGSSNGTTSSSVTITTVPATPSAPSVVTVSNTAADDVTWTAPANGGKAITNYHWTSDDGKSGDINALTVRVGQEQGTSQTYNVYATNANGNSATSSSSGSVTTFSFTPFSFTPFGFTPFGFVPAFGFAPFGFAPAYSFAPAGGKSLGPDTLVLTTNGLTSAKNIAVGDTLVSVSLPGLDNNFSFENMQSWNLSAEDFSLSDLTTTTVMNVGESTASVSVLLNAELFSGTHYMLTKRDGNVSMIATKDLLITDELWSTASSSWIAITQLIIKDIPHQVISINCEPYDMFFTENFLVYDGYQTQS